MDNFGGLATNLQKIFGKIRENFKIFIINSIIIGIAVYIYNNMMDVFYNYDFEHPALSFTSFAKLGTAIIFSIFWVLFILFYTYLPNKYEYFKITKYTNIVFISSFLLYVEIFFLFYGTPLGFRGYKSDTYLRIASIEKMRYTYKFSDFTYKDLSAFYPPLFFYISAIFANIWGIESYKMIKAGYLFTALTAPIIMYYFWKVLTEEKSAMYISIISSTFLLYIKLYYPDHQLPLFVIIPYYLYFIVNIKKKHFTQKEYVLMGILGGLIFMTYYYLYFPLIFLQLMLLILNPKEYLNRNGKHILKIALIIGITSLPYIIPLAWDIYRYGFESLQNFYFNDTMTDLPLDYFNYSLKNIILFCGLIFLIFGYKKNQILKEIGNLIIILVIINFIGYISIALRFPLFHHKLNDMIEYLLYISLGIGIRDINISARHIYNYIKHTYNPSNKKTEYRRLPDYKHYLKIFETIIIIVAVIFGGYKMSEEIIYHQYFAEAYSMRKIPEDFIQCYAALDYKNKVFLTTQYEIAAFLPIYMFVSFTPHFSHPAARHNERVDFLLNLSRITRADIFHALVINNPFDRIDYFYLDNYNDTHLRIRLIKHEREQFYPEVIYAYFSKSIFLNSTYFKEIHSGYLTFYKTL